ncbi:MAG: alpha-L-arabinofuranosidase [Fibrobacteres bacterium]|nr:alpha-L-arabinofuranosidase [Fibrobacterota bacterium]
MISQSSPSAGPCDIYATGATPCVAAYSMARPLLNSYTGPLYQVRNAAGATQDVTVKDGYANTTAQETFCGSGNCTVSIMYDQSGKGNDLIKGPKGCYTGTAALPDNEANIKGHTQMIAGHKIYGLYMIVQDGYRNDATKGMPTGSQPQGIYEIADGKHNPGASCCWDFGNASTDNCSGGTGNMATLLFGESFWGQGDGKGPWFAADLEAGVWAGGAKSGDPGWGELNGAHPANTKNISLPVDFAFGILKTSSTNYAIKSGNAQSGVLNTAYDGALPSVLHWTLKGAIVLGIGGDNSNSSGGTFYEGVITAGRPSDTTDAAIFKNVQSAGFGSSVISIGEGPQTKVPGATAFKVRYNPALAQVSIQYRLSESRRLTLAVFDTQGKRVATLVKGVVSSGSHEAFWNAKGAQAGRYIASLALDGNTAWTGNIFLEK